MSQWLSRDLNRGPSGYKPFSLTTGPHSLLETYPNRLIAVIAAKGASTKY
ncbi:UNVERIFIED_CONTAM: hypothetical protein FKN15_033404 [Acipenser sinensis]